jgi:Condensation domain/Phthiocerol/phthiodiolone dimycocerosyl transferase C-terminus
MMPLQTSPLQVKRSSVLREFSSIERMHWLMDQNHCNHFPMAAEIRGHTTVTMWRNALNDLQRRHPLLNVFIGMEENAGPVFYQAGEHKIPLVVRKRASPLQWQAEFEEEIPTPFDTSESPLMRAQLLLGDDRCEVILTTHHSIADGMAIMYVIRDLLQAVSGEKLAPLPAPPSQDELLAPILRTLPSRTSEDEADTVPVSRPTAFRRGDGARPRVTGLRLSPEQTSLLVNSARRENTSVHAAISAALVLTGRESLPAWKEHGVRVLSPISLHKALNVENDCVLALTAGIVSFAPSSGSNLWDLARWAKQALLPFQTMEGVRRMSGMLEKKFSNYANVQTVAQVMAQGMGYDLVVTNVQQFPFENRFGDLTLEGLWGPSALNGFEGEQAVGIATVNGSLHMVHTSYTPVVTFLNRAVDLLMNACRGS